MQRVMKLQRFVFVIRSFHDMIYQVFRNVFFQEYTHNKAAKYFLDILSEVTKIFGHFIKKSVNNRKMSEKKKKKTQVGRVGVSCL